MRLSAGWATTSTTPPAQRLHKASAAPSAPAIRTSTADRATPCRCTWSTVRYLPRLSTHQRVCLSCARTTMARLIQRPRVPGSRLNVARIVTVGHQAGSQSRLTRLVWKLVRRQLAVVASRCPAQTATSRLAHWAHDTRIAVSEVLP